MTRPAPAWAPPPRDGVNASRVAVSAGPWATLAEFLAARMPHAPDWPTRLARGEVLAASGQPLTRRRALRAGFRALVLAQPAGRATHPL